MPHHQPAHRRHPAQLRPIDEMDVFSQCEGSYRPSPTPTVSIIIPCRNEKEFIGHCLDSIVANDFPKDRLEVLVVDGMSTDGTRETLAAYVGRYGFIHTLDNPSKITPSAFNIGIQHSHGSLVMIMSAHAAYACDAISKCVSYSQQSDADNVGGVWKIHPRGTSIIDKALAFALSHPFGVGSALYRTVTDTRPRWVDTAAYGCYRRRVFEEVGLFNEKLVRGQDMEFNLRLKKAGGRTLLAPDVVINYYARSDFKSFWQHNLRNGIWAILPFMYTDIMPVSWRHLVPLAFVTALLGSSLLGLLIPPLLWVSLTTSVAYLAASLAASIQVVGRERDPRYLFLMPVAFAVLHFGYGLGSLLGIAKASRRQQSWRRLFGSLIGPR